ncbi:MAG: NAD(P)-dependent oxidoreductase [Candidatus Sumerlaeaceae bacterium]|nr:NAD(P)-dependent oxidoreductase [Candidatus Sumerlaeaceae bacterium]
MISGQKILVAGASGLIGSALIEALLPGKNEIHGVARFRDKAIQTRLEEQGVKTYAADVATTDFAKIPGLPKKFDIVFHELAIMLEAEVDRNYTFESNAFSVGRMIEHCADSGVFVIASTGGVYPASDNPAKETDPLGAGGTYGASKIAMEALATFLCQQHRRPLALLRYHWPFSLTRGIVPMWAGMIARREPIEVNTRIRSVVHPMWIGDTVRMTLAAVEKASSAPYIVNMAGDEVMEREALIHRIAQAMGKEPAIKEGEIPFVSHVAELTRMKADFGEVEVTLEEGIRRVVAAM